MQRIAHYGKLKIKLWSGWVHPKLWYACCAVLGSHIWYSLSFSSRNVSASFPFNKFNVIVEYGGFCGSSRVSSPPPKSVGLTHLHFLKIELDDSSASKSLYEGDIPQIAKKLTVTLFFLIWSKNLSIHWWYLFKPAILSRIMNTTAELNAWVYYFCNFSFTPRVTFCVTKFK